MPMLFIPPVLVGVLGVLGAVAVARVITKEWRRVNAELHPVKDLGGEPDIEKLTRDPETGIYRPDRARR